MFRDRANKKYSRRLTKKLNITVIEKFFGEELGKELVREGKQADLIIGNNVYAHVPDINDFTKGLKALLKADGTITLEFPHLMCLIQQTQFDTIYHEHFSYLSLHTVKRIFEKSGLKIWNVEKIMTHGGSLRIYGCHENYKRDINKKVDILLAEEIKCKLQSLETYLSFQFKIEKIIDKFKLFLIKQKHSGKKVAAYGLCSKREYFVKLCGS